MVDAFVPLESNPEVLTRLARSLGLDDSLAFHDVYSLEDRELLSFIPRPALALMLVFPISDAYENFRREQDNGRSPYAPTPEDDVIWLKQTIGNACGTYAVLHSTLNGPAFKHVRKGSILDTFKTSLTPLSTPERTTYIENSKPLEDAHAAVALDGDTAAPDPSEDVNLHYVAFVKVDSGKLYELDGRRNGPIELTTLSPDEDVLSQAAIRYVEAFMKREAEETRTTSYLSFSLVALAPALD